MLHSLSDGDWDWYNYSLVVLETSQRRDFKCTCLAAVHFNVWCAVGNMLHVVHSHLLKKEVCLSASLYHFLLPSPSFSLFHSHSAITFFFFSRPSQSITVRRLKCLTWFPLVMVFGFRLSLTPHFVSSMALRWRVCRTLILDHQCKGY